MRRRGGKKPRRSVGRLADPSQAAGRRKNYFVLDECRVFRETSWMPRATEMKEGAGSPHSPAITPLVADEGRALGCVDRVAASCLMWSGWSDSSPGDEMGRSCFVHDRRPPRLMRRASEGRDEGGGGVDSPHTMLPLVGGLGEPRPSWRRRCSPFSDIGTGIPRWRGRRHLSIVPIAGLFE